MAPRSSWKGHVQLGLVSVPVKAFTANESSETVRLNQLHKDCNQRVRYKKICAEHGELKAADIVTHRFALDEIAEAFRVAGDKTSGSIKVHIEQ